MTTTIELSQSWGLSNRDINAAVYRLRQRKVFPGEPAKKLVRIETRYNAVMKPSLSVVNDYNTDQVSALRQELRLMAIESFYAKRINVQRLLEL